MVHRKWYKHTYWMSILSHWLCLFLKLCFFFPLFVYLCIAVMFLLFLPYYMQICWTASFPLFSLPFIGLLYLLQFNLTFTIPTYCLVSCTISIWCCNMISPALIYDTHLRATDMTTNSIGGAQILIYLVNSTTDSLRWTQQYITCTSSKLRP